MINQYWKVLKTEDDYKAALERLDEIDDAALNTPEGDELELLVVLIKSYEDKHHPFKLPEPLDMIKLRMEEMGLKNKDLVEIIGSESHVSSVLSGKRQITLEMARKLSKRLNIRASIFINDDHSFENYEQDNVRRQIDFSGKIALQTGDTSNQCSKSFQEKEFNSLLGQIDKFIRVSYHGHYPMSHFPLFISYAHNTDDEHLYILADMLTSSMDKKHVHAEESDLFVRLGNEKVK